jgi:hypothetical protein
MSIDEAIEELDGNESNVRFSRLLAICEQFFGKPRKKGSHYIFKTPWAGDPRINLQDDGGKAKPYQVRQVVQALNKLKGMGG